VDAQPVRDDADSQVRPRLRHAGRCLHGHRHADGYPLGTVPLFLGGTASRAEYEWYADGQRWEADDDRCDVEASRPRRPNAAPVAQNDAYNVNEDQTLSVPAPGVLGNDTDVNSDVLSAVVAIAPGARLVDAQPPTAASRIRRTPTITGGQLYLQGETTAPSIQVSRRSRSRWRRSTTSGGRRRRLLRR